jgi:hypothetical protein
MVLQGRSSDLDIKSLMKHELASHLPSFFTNDGQVQECTCTSKVNLKNILKVESHIPARNPTGEARFLDGLQDFLDNFR